MDTHFYGGPGSIVIDNCAECEVNWLDRGELRRVALAPSGAVPEELTWNPTIGFKT
jgi:Zn-finger nucleic acid-binding protein